MYNTSRTVLSYFFIEFAVLRKRWRSISTIRWEVYLTISTGAFHWVWSQKGDIDLSTFSRHCIDTFDLYSINSELTPHANTEMNIKRRCQVGVSIKRTISIQHFIDFLTSSLSLCEIRSHVLYNLFDYINHLDSWCGV